MLGDNEEVEDRAIFDRQYEAAQQGLYERDKEARFMMAGVRPTPSMQPSAVGGAGGAGQQSPVFKPAMPASAFAQASLSRRSAAGHSLAEGGGLEEASAMSATLSTASSDKEEEHVVQTVRPEDAGPLRRFVTRSTSFTKEDFDELLEHTGLFHVQGAGGTDARLLRSHLPPSKLDGGDGGDGSNRRKRRPRHASALGLPIMRPDSAQYVAWSVVVLLSDLTYSAFIVPISIGMWTSFYETNWTTICDFLFGGIFLLDLLASLHVGFIATCGTRKLLVMNGSLVARHYLHSFNFLVDLFACLAWAMQIALIVASQNIVHFNPDTALIIMEVIRLMRFLRVYRLVMTLLRNGVYATLVIESPYLKWLRSQTLMSLLYMMYVIAVVVNFLGCLYNFTAGAEGWDGTWVNHYGPFIRRYGDGIMPLTQDEARDINRTWLYFVGLYWALTTIATVGFGDIVPQTEVEVLVVIGVEVCGVLFFGLLISSVGELLSHANRAARRVQAFRTKMQSVERWMQQNRLPTKLQRRIKTYYAEVWVRQHEVREETVLFQELPHALRNEVAWQACKGVFGKVPLLRELDDKTLYLLASKMTPFRFGPGHDLVIEGDPADRFWVLIEGEVVALYQYREAQRLEGPTVVGESVLLQEHEEALRSFPCTYRTLSSCAVWMVRCRDFKPMLATRPALHDLVKARALQALDEQMRLHPSMWRAKGLKHFDSSSLHRFSKLNRASTGTPALVGTRGDSSAHPGAPGNAAAVLSRLARTSAPAVPGQHYKSVSWGGERLGGSPVPGGGGGVLKPAAAAPGKGARGGSGDGAGRWARWEAAADKALTAAPSAGEQPVGEQQLAFRGAGAASMPAGAAPEGGATPQRALDQEVEQQPASSLQQQQQQQVLPSQGTFPAGAGARVQFSPLPPLPPLVEGVPLQPASSSGHGASQAALLRGEAPRLPAELSVGHQLSVTDESPGGTISVAGAAAKAGAAAAAAAVSAAAAAGMPRDGGPWGSEQQQQGEPLRGVLVIAEASPPDGSVARRLPAAASGGGAGVPTEGAQAARGGPEAALRSPHEGLSTGTTSAWGGGMFRESAGQSEAVPADNAGLPGSGNRQQPGAAPPAAWGDEEAEDEGGAEAAWLPGEPLLASERMTTQQALTLLKKATEAKQEEEEVVEAAREVLSATAHALAAGGSHAPGSPSVGAAGAAAVPAPGLDPAQQAALLAALLAEVQALRKQVARMHWQQPT